MVQSKKSSKKSTKKTRHLSKPTKVKTVTKKKPKVVPKKTVATIKKEDKQALVPFLVLVIVLMGTYIAFDIFLSDSPTGNVIEHETYFFTYIIHNTETYPQSCTAYFDIFQNEELFKRFENYEGIVEPNESVSGIFEVEMPYGDSEFKQYQECVPA